MTVKLAEVGKKVSAANQAKIKAAVEALVELIDTDESAESTETPVSEAAVNLGKIETLADVKRSLQTLINYIPNAITREQIEGDGDGDEAEAEVVGAAGQVVESERIATALIEAVLSTAARKNLNKSQFAVPEKSPASGSYPIPDEAHARNALTRAAGKPEESRVRAAVKKKFPNIDQDDKKQKESRIVVTEAGIACASCNEPVGRYDDFCGNCGEGLNRSYGSAAAHCVGCGSTLGPDNKYCPGCGKEAAPSVTTAKKVKEAKRGIVGKLLEKLSIELDEPLDEIEEPGETESKESVSDIDIATDFIPLKEKAIGRDGTMNIKLIAPGWGQSGYYSEDLLERDGSNAFPRGTKMFWNHPTEDEERQRPERDLRDLAAVTESAAKYLKEGPDGPGLYAPAKAVSSYKEAIEELAPHIGTSIMAAGRGKKGEAEGKRGTIVEAIVHGRSCDFVTEPGAGGKIVQLFESVRNRNTSNPKEDAVDVENEQALKESQKRLREVESERDRLQVRILLRDAHDMATDELGKVENLPAPTIRKLAETLSKDPPADEDGELDKKAFRATIKEAVRKEAEYIESIVGSGRVRGLGRSNEDWDTDDDDDDALDVSESKSSKGFADAMEKQFGRLDLNETVAKQAASGRR